MEARKDVDNTINSDQVGGSVVQAGTIDTVNFLGTPATTAVAVVLPVRSDSASPLDVFVGREEEAVRLSSALRPDSGASVLYVAGMGGVGKTALAVHCTRAAVEAGWFSGGAFSVDMQGYRADGGVSAASLLRPLLRLLGVDPSEMPTDVGEQATAYRQVLDQMGRSDEAVLLVLDNVSTASQIRGLLPVHSAHRVLITTRETLDLPGACGILLDVPTAEDATALLDSALRDLSSGDRRISDNPIGTRELVRTCGRLPLALRIVAALLADERELTPAQLAGELTEAGIVGFVHGERALAAVLDLSWQRLLRRNRAAAGLLRLLCLTVGPDCPTEVAAVLNDSSKAHALPLLRMLRQAHLLAYADERWRMHDLVRAHVEIQDAGLTPSDLQAADFRLVNHYVFSTQDAVEHMTAVPESLIRNRFARCKDALHWLDTEYPTLLAVAHKTAESGNYLYTTSLCSQLTAYQDRNGHLTDRLMIARLGYSSACAFGDLARRADMANNLGLALVQLGLITEAIDLYKSAIDLHTGNSRNSHGAAKVWNNLGNALSSIGQHGEAVRACQSAVDGYQRAGHTRKEADAWINLAGALSGDGQTKEAVHAYEKAAEMHSEIGDCEKEVVARTSVAGVLLSAGLFEDAVRANDNAIRISQANRNLTAEARAWASLGYTYQHFGHPEKADEAYQRSITLESHQNAITGNVARRWTSLGHARAEEGDFIGAVEAHREAVRVYRQIGDWYGEAMTSNNLGHVLLKRGDQHGAVEAHQIALRLTRTHHDAFGEAMTLANIGSLHHKTGSIGDAVTAFFDAAILLRRIGDAKREADAWLHCGICLHGHDPAEAAMAFHKALSIYTDSNNKEGIQAATDWLGEVLPDTYPI